MGNEGLVWVPWPRAPNIQSCSSVNPWDVKFWSGLCRDSQATFQIRSGTGCYRPNFALAQNPQQT